MSNTLSNTSLPSPTALHQQVSDFVFPGVNGFLAFAFGFIGLLMFVRAFARN